MTIDFDVFITFDSRQIHGKFWHQTIFQDFHHCAAGQCIFVTLSGRAHTQVVQACFSLTRVQLSIKNILKGMKVPAFRGCYKIPQWTHVFIRLDCQPLAHHKFTKGTCTGCLLIEEMFLFNQFLTHDRFHLTCRSTSNIDTVVI